MSLKRKIIVGRSAIHRRIFLSAEGAGKTEFRIIFFVHVFIQCNDLTDFVFMTIHKELQIEHLNRPLFLQCCCLLSNLAYEWQRGWR